MSTERPLPIVTPHNRAYWDAASRHRLLLPCCNDCGFVFYPIGPLCPRCASLALGWTEVSGRGSISSFVVYHQAFFAWFRDRLPYAVAQVELEEGPRVNGMVVDAALSDLHIGMTVEAVFERVNDEVTLPQFRPAR